MKRIVCISLFLLIVVYANAQCDYCTTSENKQMTDCLVEQSGTDTYIDLTNENAQMQFTTEVCQSQRESIKCYKECFCKCLSESPDIIASNTIVLKDYSCPDFAEGCVVWKEGNLLVNSTPVSAIASKFVMLISCLFLFMLIQ